MYPHAPRVALLLMLAIASFPLFAASPPASLPGEQDLIRDRQDRLLEEQRRRLEELKDLPGKQAVPAAPGAPVDTRCFTIQRIEFKGADSLSSAERDELIAPYQGKCLGVAQLNELLKVITDHYLEKRPGDDSRLSAATGPVHRRPASAGH